MHDLRVLDPDTSEFMKALRAALDGSGPAVLPVAAGQSAVDMAPDHPLEPDTALIVRTSGSTGTPKGVLLSAAALRASAEATHERLGGSGTWLLAMPAHHIAGVQVLVRSIVAGTEPVRMPRTAFRPKVFTESASDALGSLGPVYTALVPTQLARIVEDGGDALAALRAFDAVLVGGAAVSAATLLRALDAGVRVRTTYGMSETAGGCVYDGLPLAGVGVRIADGVIELSGPMLANGYRLDPTATAESFVDGWFRTSDTGEFRDGVLRVFGRVDDMINTGGVKVAAAAVENVLTAQGNVAEACVVGVPDAEWGQRVVAALVLTGAVDEDELRSAVRAELGAPAAPKEFRAMDALPLIGPGKPDRRALVEMFCSQGGNG
ncbi:O-succinylbenzoic acid--CoA ligase [Actinokineospora alba]|uniref:O-succinylbenzoic acid--CoA ligase n=1 Tax=Actinokineospora alba TaxID=504798 RepID=A0A1H0VDG9_9PSEU|nr:o-succinylbenzoate--CoA ligase [Actinokineospora alba]TDP65642.1 O-succinylbenzoic acid--CoA ligase [Actinokineospora alba]SDH67357.1 O-succinylbenzoic acid--CoA ligase [Actinokineospora alba]SDP76278.1 O-succinylbenzoic acid--CoA ligase [Actinokineospora alba]